MSPEESPDVTCTQRAPSGVTHFRVSDSPPAKIIVANVKNSLQRAPKSDALCNVEYQSPNRTSNMRPHNILITVKIDRVAELKMTNDFCHYYRTIAADAENLTSRT